MQGASGCAARRQNPYTFRAFHAWAPYRRCDGCDPVADATARRRPCMRPHSCIAIWGCALFFLLPDTSVCCMKCSHNSNICLNRHDDSDTKQPYRSEELHGPDLRRVGSCPPTTAKVHPRGRWCSRVVLHQALPKFGVCVGWDAGTDGTCGGCRISVTDACQFWRTPLIFIHFHGSPCSGTI
jgi:hypothetical protein